MCLCIVYVSILYIKLQMTLINSIYYYYRRTLLMLHQCYFQNFVFLIHFIFKHGVRADVFVLHTVLISTPIKLMMIGDRGA